MKKLFLYCFFCVTALPSFAQSVAPSSIEDSVIGWMKLYYFKGAKQPLKVDSRVYSPAQLSICDSFANWIQASYIPKGGLGDVRKSVSERLGQYNQNTAALPQSYGAYAKVYTFLKRNSNGKLVPENSLGLSWSIMANAVPGWEIRDISTPDQYYFTMPSFENASDPQAIEKIHDLTKNKNLNRYSTFWIKNIEAGNGTDYVLLCKDNRSPFIKLTKGEYLNILEQAIPRVYQQEKKKIYEKEQGNARAITYDMTYLDQKNEKRVSFLKQTKEKYRNRLGEIALTSAQPSLTELETGRDIFSNGYLSDAESTSGRMPVYKIDPVMAELCKKDKPQWILVSWWWSPNQPVEKHLHESIINNFNFDYLYNFFFDPEKVKAQPYKPLRSPLSKEAVVVTELSAAGKKNQADKNIDFFEDFSSTGIGQKPIGWKSNLSSNGTTSRVIQLDGLEGKWASLTGHQLIPVQVKKPLPQDFTLSFDLVAAKDFTWGAKGLTFRLSKETSAGNAESYLDLRLRPGFDGRAGEATIDAKFPSPPGYLNGTKWAQAPGFSNNKKNNLITVTVKKSGERLQIFIDNNQIADYEKAIPAALLFNAFSFNTAGNAEPRDTYYISNIKITRDQVAASGF